MSKSQTPKWQYYSTKVHTMPPHLRAWLLHSASFIDRLKLHGVMHPRVKVLQEVWEVPFSTERKRLNMRFDEVALIREVLILSEGTIWGFARSVFPKQMLTGKESELAHLKTRSLGSVIFKDPTLTRSEFEICELHPGMDWYQKVAHHVDLQDKPLWARRSLFNLQQKEFLLTEVFMPEIATLC